MLNFYYRNFSHCIDYLLWAIVIIATVIGYVIGATVLHSKPFMGGVLCGLFGMFTGFLVSIIFGLIFSKLQKMETKHGG